MPARNGTTLTMSTEESCREKRVMLKSGGRVPYARCLLQGLGLCLGKCFLGYLLFEHLCIYFGVNMVIDVVPLPLSID